MPPAVAGYFRHESTDPQAVAACFTGDGLVVDEQHEHRGRADIAAWIASAIAKYAARSEVLAIEGEPAAPIVRARVSGTFPGSPIELRYHFTLRDDRIERLQIAP